MNLHQFRFVQEAARRNLNLTEAAKALHTSQPGVSKAIIELEHELGIDIFARHGKRLKRITEPGQHVLKSIEVIMREIGNLKRIGEQYSAQDSGTLSIATTHTQARYVLPVPVAKLRDLYPHVNISLHQGSPDQVAKMLLDDTAEIGMATESLANYEDLVTVPCYEWQHMLVLPPDHPLAHKKNLHYTETCAKQLNECDSCFIHCLKLVGVDAVDLQQLRSCMMTRDLPKHMITTLCCSIGIQCRLKPFTFNEEGKKQNITTYGEPSERYPDVVMIGLINNHYFLILNIKKK